MITFIIILWSSLVINIVSLESELRVVISNCLGKNRLLWLLNLHVETLIICYTKDFLHLREWTGESSDYFSYYQLLSTPFFNFLVLLRSSFC